MFSEIPFELSVYSLILFLVLPFSYFFLHDRYWYSRSKLKSIDFGLQAISALLGVLVIAYMVVGVLSLSMEGKAVAVLHLAPTVLTFLIISLGKRSFGLPVAQKSNDEKDREFSPRPENKGIEELSWDDLIVSEKLRKELTSVIQLLKSPQSAKEYGIDPPKGILLQGPPGTGKTTIAKVIANTAGLSFFVFRQDDVVSKWVGESEKNLTKLFETAEKHAPAVIFIDEVDSIGKARSGSGHSSSENLLNHLLQLIDGVKKVEGIYIIAATNRAELVDSALKRPGRLNKVVEIPLPNTSERQQLFELHLSKLNLEPGFDLLALSQVTEGCSGAVIKAICNQAGLNAFQREADLPESARSFVVSREDLNLALEEFVAQVRPANSFMRAS